MTLIKGQIERNETQQSAVLHCELGDFTVRDANHFPSGVTTGCFELTHLKPATQKRGDTIIMIVEATLGDVILQQTATTNTSTEDNSQRPANENTIEPQPESKANEDVTVDTRAKTLDGTLKEQCMALYLPYPLPDRVDFDPTLDRDIIRAQKSLLKKQGYNFRYIDQTWMIKESV